MDEPVAERLVSADSHIGLTQTQVKAHLASEHHDAYDAAVADFEHNVMQKAPGRENTSWTGERTHPAAGRPGHHDPLERLQDMDTDGVDTEILYCEVSAFRYLYMVKDAWRQATRAFNAALQEFASADPKRLVVSYQIPVHDIDFAVEEVQRIAAAGGKSLQLPVFPAELGFPDYYDDRYAPLWSAIQETELPICCHIGLNTGLADLIKRDPTPQKLMLNTQVPLATGEAFGMWIFTGVLERFPRLKVVFVEPFLGWIDWFLTTVDDMVERRGFMTPNCSELPSFYFHRNVSVTFVHEPRAISQSRHLIGVENILWSSDYPHPVSSWPNSRALVEEQFRDIPADERELITSGNAIRVWNL